MGSVIKFGEEHAVTGRGRCAREGLNCTLTGTPAGVRAFCERLRAWDPAFMETDFKLTDGLAPDQRFKALTIRKTVEIVAYGLPGELAPSLHRNEAKHVPADEYHRMMSEDNTVIIDVRNYYESDIGPSPLDHCGIRAQHAVATDCVLTACRVRLSLVASRCRAPWPSHRQRVGFAETTPASPPVAGHFQPPPGGAELIDPKMRNSHEFPKCTASCFDIGGGTLL